MASLDTLLKTMRLEGDPDRGREWEWLTWKDGLILCLSARCNLPLHPLLLLCVRGRLCVFMCEVTCMFFTRCQAWCAHCGAVNFWNSNKNLMSTEYEYEICNFLPHSIYTTTCIHVVQNVRSSDVKRSLVFVRNPCLLWSIIEQLKRLS